MTSSITALVAHEHAADLRRVAQGGRSRGSTTETNLPAIELRLATVAEVRVVARLAELDDALALEGPVLLALIDGEAEAGLSLQDGRVVANPFVSTHEAVALLRIRAAAVNRARGSGHRLSSLLARVDMRVQARLHRQAPAGF